MIIPIRNLLYVLPLDDPSPIGTIIAPDTVGKRNAEQGIVKYRGPDTSGEIRVGDHVLFSSYEGDLLVVEGEGRIVAIPEPAIDCLLGEGDNHLLTIAQVHLSIRRAASELMHLTRDNKEAMLIDTLASRLTHHLDKRFFDDLVK